MPSEVTLQDVADRAGVHRSTVALALRDHHRIGKGTRERIQSLAREMGYRTNPLVAALMRSRRSGRAVKHVTLAFVTNYSTKFGWRPPQHDRPDFFPGAAARAAELGYKLEHFWLREPGMTPARFRKVLRARSIPGLLVGRLPPGEHELAFEWADFACVAVGLTLRAPVLHHVTEDHFDTAARSVHEAVARGYQRIGFVFSEADDSPRVADRWLGACLRENVRQPTTRLTKPFYHEAAHDLEGRFHTWLRAENPDVLFVTHPVPVIRWLATLDLIPGRHIGLIAMVNDHPDRDRTAGVYYDPAHLGATATEMLVGLLHRGECGVPIAANKIAISGVWRDGATLPTRASLQR